MFVGKFFHKNKAGKDLTLGDYKSIWCKFCFLDESGSLNNPTEPFFTVGFIKCSQPYYLQSKILYERNKRQFYDELKFNKLSKNNFDFAVFALDAFFSTNSFSFCSYALDKQGEYFQRTFGANPWQAYEDISIRVIQSNISQNEILTIIADHVTVPKDIKFEVNVKRKINDALGRLSVAGVARFDSKSNDLLQLTDLMIGAVTYDLKFAAGIIQKGDKYKRRFLEHFRKNLGINTFMEGFQNYHFNIFVDKDVKRRLPIVGNISANTNEKGPSS
ncbi:MAG: DUF3800 domain-containing protein [Candidatus Azambacteria bacterium]|nr:DUF3800 domain-containing protein [Candidatus Azambacteria bacterium]